MSKIYVDGSINQDLVDGMDKVPDRGETVFGDSLQLFAGEMVRIKPLPRIGTPIAKSLLGKLVWIRSESTCGIFGVDRHRTRVVDR